ncbi:MAG: T9SS type A sorting domain-containing protein, partial [Proteobacteria bacterium]
ASIGINTENTNPNTWTNFAPMTYNAAATTAGNNDEYLAQIGAGLAPGTYYYATRFRLNNGPFVYGGITTTGNGGIWDGTVYISGVLTVSPPPAPNNDLCANAQPLTVGGQFATNPVTGTTLGGTDTTGLPTFGCQTNRNSDVWYTAVVPASGTLTVETKAATGTGTLMTDSVVSVYTGTCGSLVEVGCNDDDGDLNFSLVSIVTGLTPGATVYIGVWKYGASAAGQFQVSAYDASLSTGDINRAGFNFYPNPVTSVLNLSHTSDIKTATVFNMLGQQVMVRNINASEAQLDMTSLPKGTYMVKLSANEGTKTIKIVKE